MDRVTDRPNMTSAFDRGRKALTQTNQVLRVLIPGFQLEKTKHCVIQKFILYLFIKNVNS